MSDTTGCSDEALRMAYEYGRQVASARAEAVDSNVGYFWIATLVVIGVVVVIVVRMIFEEEARKDRVRDTREMLRREGAK